MTSRLVALLGLLLVPALAGAAPLASPSRPRLARHDAPPPSPAAMPPATDLDAVASAGDDDTAQFSRRLGTRLGPVLAQRCLANARTAVTIRDRATGAVLYTRNGDLPLAPASNMKLVTSAAVQAILGPEHEIETRVRVEHRPDASGDAGQLWIVGGGDPSLDVEALYAIARDVAAAGVRKVSSVVADDSYFDGPGRAPSWPTRNFDEWYSAPCSALSANYNVVSVCARGGDRGGEASVWVDPFPTFFDLEGRVATGRGAWSIRSELERPMEGAETCVQRLSVGGRVPAGETCRELRAVEDPPLFCAHGFMESLRRVGIEVTSPPGHGAAPATSVLLVTHASRPVSLLVHDMNKVSSNVFAETLLRDLGAEILGAPGTREKGLAVAAAYLETVSPRAASAHLEDGSGLSPADRLTTNVLTDLLVSVAADPYTFPEFEVSLPVGGVDGTLRRRLDGTSAQRLVRAKTGRIDGVVALSGFARVQDTRDATFSILVNDPSCASWQVQDEVDQLVIAMVAEATPAPNLRARIDVEKLRRDLVNGEAHVQASPAASSAPTGQ